MFALAMPTLHKRARSPFYVAAFTAGDGRRLKKSTKTGNRSLAMKLAVEWENLAKVGRAGRLVESQCRRVISEIHEHAKGESLHFHTANAWMNEWLAGKKGVTTERTNAKYQQIIAEFIQHAGERANIPLAAISPRDVRSFRDALARAGHSLRRSTARLKSLLRHSTLAFGLDTLRLIQSLLSSLCAMMPIQRKTCFLRNKSAHSSPRRTVNGKV
jgi:hypothetical protein